MPDRQTECCVARKELRETNAANEIRNLRHIQCSLVSHERIIQHLAMYKVGSLCNIIFPLADTDLGKFLELPQYEKQFDAPRYIERFISEAAHLAGAVEFLHGSLERPDETNSFCCHMDLKTDNILVFLRDDGSFQWKITDFGISRIKPDPKKPVTLGELVDRLATKTRARRSGGEFQAPEMHMERYVGRKSDVWSLGCILIKVIIRGIIGATRLGEFDASRRTNEFFDDYFYDGPNLKFPVQRWLDQLCDGRGEYMGMLCSGLGFEQPQAEAILSECHTIISWSLNHDPKHRFEAATVKSRLRAVSGALSMLPSMNAGLGHASSVDLDQSYPTHCEIVCLNESTTAHLEARNTPADPFPSRFAPQPSATNGALLRLQTRHSWFDPRSFRQQAYNYKVSTKTSRDISKWLEPASSTPILILVDPHDITASLSKVTHSFCAANEPPTKWFIIPCFSFPAPRKPTVPFRRPMFLDLLISIVAGLLPVHRTLNSLANDAEQLEALSKENVHLACGLALKMISDLLGQLTGSFLILIDEFSRFNDASVGETGELWTKLLSALAKCNEKENRLVRVFVRTKHRSRALDFAGTLQSVVMAGSQSLATVPLKKLVQERLL
jgi:serine/threonine protein kinase